VRLPTPRCTPAAALTTIAPAHLPSITAPLRHGGLLGGPEGRSAPEWVDFDFFGHQIVAHLSPGECGHRNTSPVDGEDVPVRHFGAVLPMAEWEQLAEKLKAADTRFVIEPQIRFQGQPGEQATMFFLDPAGNALEFKAFGDIGQLFARQ